MHQIVVVWSRKVNDGMSASAMPLEITVACYIVKNDSVCGPVVRMALAGAVLLLHITTLIITPSQITELRSLIGHTRMFKWCG